MKVTIIKGEFKGKSGEVIQATEGSSQKLAGGPTAENSVTVLVEGMLHPIEMNESDVQKSENQ